MNLSKKEPIYLPRKSLRAVIPTIISQTLFNNGKVKLGNISSKRDFTYIQDTVNAFKLAIKNKKIIGETLNIGNNFEISIKEIVNTVKRLTGINIKIINDKTRFRPINSEVNRLFCCNKKAKKILNWKINFRSRKGFESGLTKTIDWIRQNKEDFYKDKIKKYII